MANNKPDVWIIVMVVLLGIVVYQGGFLSGFGLVPSGGGTGTGDGTTDTGAGTVGGVITICDPSAKTTLTVSSWDLFARSS